MIKIKENAVDNFANMIIHSWTYARLNHHERQSFLDELFKQDSIGNIKGDYKTRWNICQLAYSCFLAALDYAPLNWRETEEERANNPRF